MNIRKSITGLAAVVGMMAVAAGATFAQQTSIATVAGVTSGSVSSNSVFTYTGGATGAFTITSGASFSANGTAFNPVLATLTMSGLSNVGTVSGTGTSADPYSQTLSGGSFTLTQNSNSAVLLTGNFTAANLLVGTNGTQAPTVSDNLNNVTYTGGSYFSGYTNPGQLSFSLTGANPSLSVTNGYFNRFTAGGTGTFSAVTATVPEPGTYAAFAFTGIGAMGLMLRARKSRGGMVA